MSILGSIGLKMTPFDDGKHIDPCGLADVLAVINSKLLQLTAENHDLRKKVESLFIELEKAKYPLLTYQTYPLVPVKVPVTNWPQQWMLTPSQQGDIIDSSSETIWWLDVNQPSLHVEVSMPSIQVPVPSWDSVPQLANDVKFNQGMERAIEIREAIETLESELSRIKEEELEPSLIGAGVKGRVKYGQWEVGVVQRKGSTRIDRKKLVQALESAGVQPEPIVSAASVTGADSVYLWLGRSKPANGDPGEDE